MTERETGAGGAGRTVGDETVEDFIARAEKLSATALIVQITVERAYRAGHLTAQQRSELFTTYLDFYTLEVLQSTLDFVRENYKNYRRSPEQFELFLAAGLYEGQKRLSEATLRAENMEVMLEPSDGSRATASKWSPWE
jgi:hypothetical protein